MTICPNCKETQSQPDGELLAPYCAICRFPVQLLAGTYRLEKKLGSGGFGVVYLGRHKNNHQPYAIKLLRPEILEQLAAHLDPKMGAKKQRELLRRFQQEIRVTTDLSKENPHIVQIFDVGQDPALGHFYIMEYLDGDTLEHHLANKGELPLKELIPIFEQLCQAVAAAHYHSIVHRDLKPSNIFLLPMQDGRYFIKVIDFGIAKSLLAPSNITQTTGVLGSMMYLSPEQGRSEQVDQRTDIYALGGLFYRLLTGTPPYLEEGTTALLLAHLQKPHEPMSQRRPDLNISPHLDAIIAKAMAKAPDDRYHEVEFFWQELRREVTIMLRLTPTHQNTEINSTTLVEGSPAMKALWEAGRLQGLLFAPEPPPRAKDALFATSSDLFEEEKAIPHGVPSLKDALSFDDLPMEEEERTMLSFPTDALQSRETAASSLRATITHKEPVFSDEITDSNLFLDDGVDAIEAEKALLQEIDLAMKQSQKSSLRKSLNDTQMTPAIRRPDAKVDPRQTSVDAPDAAGVSLAPKAQDESAQATMRDNASASELARSFEALRASGDVHRTSGDILPTLKSSGLPQAQSRELRTPIPGSTPPPVSTVSPPQPSHESLFEQIANKRDFQPSKTSPLARAFVKTEIDEDGSFAKQIREVAEAHEREKANQPPLAKTPPLSLHSNPPPHTLHHMDPLPAPQAVQISQGSYDKRPKHTLGISNDVLTPQKQLPTRDLKAPGKQAEGHRHSLAISDADRHARDIVEVTATNPQVISAASPSQELAGNTDTKQPVQEPLLQAAALAPQHDPALPIPDPIEDSNDATQLSSLPQAPPNHRTKFLWLGALLCLCLAGGGWAWMQHASSQKIDAPQTPASRQGPAKRRALTPPPKARARQLPLPPPGTKKELPGLPNASVVWLPPGAFQLGSPQDELGRLAQEGPQTKVILNQGFWIWQTEITQAQFQAVMGFNPAQFQSCGPQCPVESVSWHQAVVFANKLSLRLKAETCYTCTTQDKKATCRMRAKWLTPSGQKYNQCPGFRLPTEAEWEYAARAGTTTALYTGTHEVRQRIRTSRLARIAWFRQNSDTEYDGAFKCPDNNPKRRCGTHKVGLKQPNAWGLYDMLGNVWEWVADGYTPKYPGGTVRDPLTLNPQSGVSRGGSWNSAPQMIRSAYRGRLNPFKAYSSVGFRVVKTGP